VCVCMSVNSIIKNTDTFLFIKEFRNMNSTERGAMLNGNVY
jgi:hypothetical protein